MTINQTYDYLLQIKVIDTEIKNKTLQYETLKSCLLPSGIRYDLDRVQTTPDDQLAAIEAKCYDLEKEIRDLKHNKDRILVAITQAIYKLADDSEKTVLLSYYIGKKKIEVIAEEMPCSVRTVFYIKRKAVSHLAKLL